MDKIYANYISNKGLESRIHLEPNVIIQQGKKGGNNPIRKTSKEMERHFNNENI